MVPTVGQIWDREAEYYGLITSIIATPSDFMVQLDDIGIDFSTISPFELFLLLFNGLKGTDTSMVFGDLDLSKFKTAINEQNGKNDIVMVVDGDENEDFYLQLIGQIRKKYEIKSSNMAFCKILELAKKQMESEVTE